MPSFSLRVLILVAIGAILVIRTLRRFAPNSSGRVNKAARTVGNSFCIHCGGPLANEGLFCGGCGARRS
jgi:hypothetical protein